VVLTIVAFLIAYLSWLLFRQSETSDDR